VDIIVGSIIYCTNCKHYAFLLDIYIAKEEDAADYYQLFRDAEWEEVFSWEGTNGKWYYFCKKAENGKREKIYDFIKEPAIGAILNIITNFIIVLGILLKPYS